jgi:hypothetical protein
MPHCGTKLKNSITWSVKQEARKILTLYKAIFIHTITLFKKLFDTARTGYWFRWP